MSWEEQYYIYTWDNDEKQKAMKGRTCRVICQPGPTLVFVEFENGQKEIVHQSALRKVESD